MLRPLTVALATLGMLAAGSLAAPVAAAPVVAAPVAAAADASGFNAGNIISDAVFYDSGAMTAAQVQAFLNEQGRNCRPASGGPACLKDYRTTTSSRPAETNLCSAYTGRSESAAEIIARVGQACGINPQVLLVLLQKETSLVTKTAPTTSNYNRATGFGCPDTGPGNTANCDTQYYGFFNQLYRAARQYKVYRANPTRYNYQAGRVNQIQYHPNTSCGRSGVYIENQATAGLYIYTPYQPNAAALRNMYGTGDSCSAYGNRNFWRLFTDWFGSTQVSGSVLQYRAHVQNVGWQGWLAQGNTAGTTGSALRVEAIQFNAPGRAGEVQCRAHVQNVGWTGWANGPGTCGTEGRGLRVEAMQLRLSGSLAAQYDIWYRLHVQNIGWMGWARNGATAGTAGLALRVEAVQAVLVPRGGAAPGSTANASVTIPSARYRAHVQNVGWQGWVGQGGLAGTTGRSLRVEGLQIENPRTVWSGGIECQAHVQNVGWTAWTGGGGTCGTTGRGLRVEAVTLRVTGNLDQLIDVWYRVHVQDVGWTGWTKDGSGAGTTGRGLRIEAIEIRIDHQGSRRPS
ncbi:hypothetical protein DNL40_05505 [Xylanimonas oleitrophica]|uniref:Hydrophobic W protein n=1 Tax=Xylanimonas oleitrophica TaxID=2607479 RepID=A0A2W5WUQ1_9MICO|nr:hypothetical protein DNL40_05505 [Xylanimonas oleitrophica]